MLLIPKDRKPQLCEARSVAFGHPSRLTLQAVVGRAVGSVGHVEGEGQSQDGADHTLRTSAIKGQFLGWGVVWG